MTSPPSDSDLTVGADLGGTWTRVGLVDTAGRLLEHRRVPTPDGRQQQEAVLTGLCADLVAAHDVAAVGVAVAGIVRDGSVAFAANHELVGTVQADLEKSLRRTVRLVNDAQAAAVYEARLGLARGHRHVVYVTVGTGIGGASVEDGDLQVGRGAAGEFGHLTLASDGPACPCGGSGCWEMLASGGALRRLARESAANSNSTYLSNALRTQGDVGGAQLGAGAIAGDPECHRIMTSVALTCGRGLAALVAAFDPDVLIVAGGVFGSEFLRDAVERSYGEQHPHWAAPPLVFTGSSDRAGVIGAALLARDAA